MAMICTEITEWIENEVSKPIEEWEEETYKECKKKSRWNPLRWLCWLATRLVKVIRWIVVTVLTAVVTIVCNFIADLIGIFIGLIKFFAFILAGLFTWNQCLVKEGLAGLGDSLVGAYTILGDSLFRPIIQKVQLYRLSNYVEERIDDVYQDRPAVAEALKKKLNVNFGSFGYNITSTVHRMYVDSSTPSLTDPTVPNLWKLHDTNEIDLYKLAGFDRNCSIFAWSWPPIDKEGWYFPRPFAVKSPFQSGSPSYLTRGELDEYVNSSGQGGPHFRIYAMSADNLGTRKRTASEMGRQLGLKFDFKDVDIEVTDADYINYKRAALSPVGAKCSMRAKGQMEFLICELNRKPKTDFECCPQGQDPPIIVSANPNGALEDLCWPPAVGVFGFVDKHTRGLAYNLIGTNHCSIDRQLDPMTASGLSFIDDIPDEIRKYVLIHEMGHYLGLCHVDGFDRIMVSGSNDPAQGSAWTWKALPNTFVHGGPRFIYAEATRVWDFILPNFPLSCFGIYENPIL